MTSLKAYASDLSDQEWAILAILAHEGGTYCCTRLLQKNRLP